MGTYEIGFLFGLFFLSFFFLYLAESFKVEGTNAKKALLSGVLGMMLRLMSVATIIYSVFFLRLILQDQVQSPAILNMLSVYDTYMNLFMYGFGVLFFLFYFLHQFVTLLENYKIHKFNKSTERKFG